MNEARPAGQERPEDYEIVIVHSFAVVQALRSLLDEAESSRDLYATWSWFENLDRFGLEPELCRLLVVMTHRTSGAACCLPLLARDRREAALWGGAVTSMSNYYSSLFAPLGPDHACTVAALRAALSHIRRHVPQSAVLDFQPLEEDGVFHRRLVQALRAEGYVSEDYFCFGNWHLQIAGRSFAAYEPSIPSKLRNTYKRGRKKLDGAGTWSLEVHSNEGPQLEAGINDWQTVYIKSWKTPEPFPDFVPSLCRMAAQRGWLRLGVIRLNGQPIAAQIWLIKDGFALIYKLAYDEAYKQLSAGSVLSAELMRRAIDDERVVDVDYLTGDDAYKADWMSHRRARVGVVAFKPTSPRGALSLARQRLGGWLRRLRRSSTTAPVPATDA